MNANPVTTLLKQKTTIKAHEYSICGHACELYIEDTEDQVCSFCKVEDRLPVQKMKMMSIGDQLAKLVGNEGTRQKMAYRANRVEDPVNLQDYFDGQDYKKFKANNLFTSEEDVAIALYVDGFVTQKKSKQELVIVHVMVLNYDPTLR